MYIIHCILSSIDFICIFYSFGIDYIRHNFITRFEHHWVVFFGLWRAGFTPVFATSRTCGGNGVLEGLWWTGLAPVFATSRTCGGNGDLEGLWGVDLDFVFATSRMCGGNVVGAELAALFHRGRGPSLEVSDPTPGGARVSKCSRIKLSWKSS